MEKRITRAVITGLLCAFIDEVQCPDGAFNHGKRQSDDRFG
jgi:hypothetical protein